MRQAAVGFRYGTAVTSCANQNHRVYDDDGCTVQLRTKQLVTKSLVKVSHGESEARAAVKNITGTYQSVNLSLAMTDELELLRVRFIASHAG